MPAAQQQTHTQEVVWTWWVRSGRHPQWASTNPKTFPSSISWNDGTDPSQWTSTEPPACPSSVSWNGDVDPPSLMWNDGVDPPSVSWNDGVDPPSLTWNGGADLFRLHKGFPGSTCETGTNCCGISTLSSWPFGNHLDIPEVGRGNAQ